jgi:hypothetical protein
MFRIRFCSEGNPSTFERKNDAPSQCGENDPEASFAANSVDGQDPSTIATNTSWTTSDVRRVGIGRSRKIVSVS